MNGTGDHHVQQNRFKYINTACFSYTHKYYTYRNKKETSGNQKVHFQIWGKGPGEEERKGRSNGNEITQDRLYVYINIKKSHYSVLLMCNNKKSGVFNVMVLTVGSSKSE